MTPAEFHTRVVNLARKRNTPIRQLEIRSGIPEGTIKSWKKAIPAGDRILIIASQLDVSIDFLLGRTDDEFAHKGHSFSSATNKLIQFSEKWKISEKVSDVAICIMNSLLTQFTSGK